MRVLLTQIPSPREPRTPISLMDLAAYGRQRGHAIDVAYLDDAVNTDGYDFIGLSSLTFNRSVVASIAALRQQYPGRIIFGGKGAETLLGKDREELARFEVEVFRGPGEHLFNDNTAIDYEHYPAWSIDDFSSLDTEQIMREAMSSRGCPYCCCFCHNTEPKVQHFSAERTVVNASLILDTVGRPTVFFVDDVFALRADRMYSLLETADKAGLELRKRTQFFVHISLIDDGRLAAIDAFKPTELQVGIESADDGMLEEMGKTFTAAKAQERLRLLHGHGHQVACLFLMGFPGETRQSLQATVEFVQNNRQYMSGWWVSYYQPVPMTRGWEMAKERVGEVNGGWNTEITYLDPNLTVDDLVSARKAIMMD